VGAPHILITDLGKAAKLESILDRYIVPDYRWKFEGAIRCLANRHRLLLGSTKQVQQPPPKAGGGGGNH
jgi:hypothetical protein